MICFVTYKTSVWQQFNQLIACSEILFLCILFHFYISGMSHTTWLMCFAGSFGEAGARTDQYVDWLREYCQVFFYGLTVKMLPAVTVAQTGCTFRVNRNSQNLQILTGRFGPQRKRNAKNSKLKYNSWLLKLLLIIGDLLRFLQNRQPEDAFCIVGITMIDLYPKESWNFVFGQASLSMGMVFVNIGFCIANYVNTYIGIQDIMYCIVNQSKLLLCK